MSAADGLVTAAMRERLFRIAVAVCGDPDLAEEAVADAIARSWPKLSAGRVDDPGAYLRRAVLNALHGRFRRRGLERRVQGRRTGDDRGGRDRIAEVGDRAEILAALAVLSQRQRTVVVLRFYEDLTNAQIAEAVGMPVGTVKSTMSRAIERLRDAMEENDHV